MRNKKGQFVKATPKKVDLTGYNRRGELKKYAGAKKLVKGQTSAQELKAMENRIGFYNGTDDEGNEKFFYPDQATPSLGVVGPTHGRSAPGRYDELIAQGRGKMENGRYTVI